VKPLAAAECVRCGHVVFPRLLLCPRCAGSEWRRRVLEAGTVEQATAIRRMPGADPAAPVPVGSVRGDAGPIVVARLEPGIGPGESVVLGEEGGAPLARKPQTSTA
jgi:uncharacterized OB-fold protein